MIQTSYDSSSMHDQNNCINNENVVLITGGLGRLGIVTEEVIVEIGARCVVLVSRSITVNNSDQGLNERLNKLHSSNTEISIDLCDTDVEEVISLLNRVRSCHGYVSALIHEAGVIHDAIMQNQNLDNFRKVFIPKANGAWYLHKHTLNDNLQRFLVLSSIVSLIGNYSQIIYSAANSYLDELILWRRSKGLVGDRTQ